MCKKLRTICYFAISFLGLLAAEVGYSDVGSHDQQLQGSLFWELETSKTAFYPGEPVPLYLRIENLAAQDEGIFFGRDGIEAFSMETRDANGNVMNRGDKIRRSGCARPGIERVVAGEVGQKSIVSNQWCSTLLPPGQYRIHCTIEYAILSEVKDHKIGPMHKVELELPIELLAANELAFKKILENLAELAFVRPVDTRKEWQDRRLAREMLCFTESDLAVPYQLNVLKVDHHTWLKRDAINALVRSETVMSAEGLCELIRRCSVYGAEDAKPDLIRAVYKLRESDNPDLLKVTDDIVIEYPQP